MSTGQLKKAYNTNRNRKPIKNKLEFLEAETGYKLTFKSINLVFYDQLKEYILETKDHRYNYLSAITDKFKAFMNWSFQSMYHNNQNRSQQPEPYKELLKKGVNLDDINELFNQLENA